MKLSHYITSLNEKIPGWVKSGLIFFLGYIATRLLDHLQFKSIFVYNPYGYIGKQEFNSSPFTPYLILMGVILFGLFFVSFLRKKNYIYSIFFFLITILYIAVTPNAFAENQAIKYFKLTNTNLAIIRPYISDKAFYKMKSDLYQVDSKQKFDTLDNQIKKVANDAKVKIYPQNS